MFVLHDLNDEERILRDDISVIVQILDERYTAERDSVNLAYTFQNEVTVPDFRTDVSVLVDTTNPYVDHQFTLQARLGMDLTIKKVLHIYLIKRGEIPLNDILDRAVRNFRLGRLSNAYSAFRYAFDQSYNSSTLLHRAFTVEYSYAATLQRICISPKYYYDTCAEADDWFARLPKSYSLLEEQKDNIADARRDIKIHQELLKHRYYLGRLSFAKTGLKRAISERDPAKKRRDSKAII